MLAAWFHLKVGGINIMPAQNATSANNMLHAALRRSLADIWKIATTTNAANEMKQPDERQVIPSVVLPLSIIPGLPGMCKLQYG